MSDAVKIQLIASITTLFTVIGGIAAVIGAVMLKRIELQSKAAAEKVEEVAVKQDKAVAEVKEVKDQLKETNAETAKELDGIKKQGKATHVLVNAKLGTQLREKAEDKHRIAEMSGLATDLAIAEAADREYEAHQRAQALVDAQPGTDAEKGGTG